MVKRNAVPSAPFSFELDQSHFRALGQLRRRLGNPSLRLLVEHSLGLLEGAGAVPPKEKKQQLSVRLGPEARDTLRKYSRSGSVSAGEVLRTALTLLVEASPSREDLHSTQAAMPRKSSVTKTSSAVKKSARKRTAKKAAPSKKSAARKATAKRAVKKAPAKKASTKKAAKKAVAKKAVKKAATKKAVKKAAGKAAKKAPVKKTPARKAVKKAPAKKGPASKGTGSVLARRSAPRVARKSRRSGPR